MSLIIEHGKEYYCKTLGRNVTFLKWDTAGLAMVVDASGEPHTVNENDLSPRQWTADEILEREA